MNREDFESIGDVWFWEPRPFPGKFDKGDGMVDGGVVKGEVPTRDQAIDAGDDTTVGCWKIDEDMLLSGVFLVCDAKGADAEVKKLRTGKFNLISKDTDGCVESPGWKPSSGPL